MDSTDTAAWQAGNVALNFPIALLDLSADTAGERLQIVVGVDELFVAAGQERVQTGYLLHNTMLPTGDSRCDVTALVAKSD